MVTVTPDLAQSVGLVAPYYNLALVIVVIILFLVLFKIPNKKFFIKPWKFLFFAILVFVLEEIITVLGAAGLFTVSPLTFPLLEMVIIIAFTYMLLLQKDYVKKIK